MARSSRYLSLLTVLLILAFSGQVLAQNRNARMPVYVVNQGDAPVFVALQNSSMHGYMTVEPGQSQFFLSEENKKRLLFPPTVQVILNYKTTGSTLGELGELKQARAGFWYWKLTVGAGGVDP